MKQVFRSPVGGSTEAHKQKNVDLSNCLKNLCGFQTCTGQIDWNTIDWNTVPLNSIAGFEVFYFNDTLHATHPIFIKIEYGKSASLTTAYNGWSLYITVGKTVDGSGNITNVLFPRTCVFDQQFHGTNNESLDVNSNVFLGNYDGSLVTVNFYPNIADVFVSNRHVGGYFFIERSRDSNNTPTSDSVIIGYSRRVFNVSTSSTSTSECYIVNYSTLSSVILNSAPINTQTSIAANLQLSDRDYGRVFNCDGVMSPNTSINLWHPISIKGCGTFSVGGGTKFKINNIDYICAGYSGGCTGHTLSRFHTALILYQ